MTLSADTHVVLYREYKRAREKRNEMNRGSGQNGCMLNECVGMIIAMYA